jgi:hypothetical protein
MDVLLEGLTVRFHEPIAVNDTGRKAATGVEYFELEVAFLCFPNALDLAGRRSLSESRVICNPVTPAVTMTASENFLRRDFIISLPFLDGKKLR